MRGAFKSLGVELRKHCALYEFEYEHAPMFLSEEEKVQSLGVLTYVVDSGDGCMNENVMKSALDVVEGFHKDYGGDWNDGVPYFTSPCYSLEDVKEVSAEWLQLELRSFREAYIFLEANIHIIDDPGFYGLLQEDG